MPVTIPIKINAGVEQCPVFKHIFRGLEHRLFNGKADVQTLLQPDILKALGKL